MSPADPPKLVIFDLDGTLIDFEHDHFYTEALRLLPRFGYSNLGRSELEALFSRHNMFGFVDEASREEFENTFWLHYDGSGAPGPRVLDGVTQTLEALRKNGIAMAIATARSEQASDIERSLADTGLLDYITVVSSRGVGNLTWRNKAQQILDLCKGFGVPVESSMMVGDTPVDICSGKLAGSRATVGLLSGGILEDVLRQYEPTYLLESLTEFPETMGLF